jgi:aspartate-semialdehyde dehydrogenase
MENQKRIRIGIVGASTLMGREIKSVLAERKLPISKLVLMDQLDEIGHLTEFEGEPFLSQTIEENNFADLDAVFFASDCFVTRQFAPLAAQNGCFSIDTSQAFIEDSSIPLYASKNLIRETGSLEKCSLISLPHSAALALAILSNLLQSLGKIKGMVFTLLEPAAERGSPGLEELERQTLSIFSFQQMPKHIFDRQLAFNLLSSLGIEAKEDLSAVESRIILQLRRLLAPNACFPALTLIQAPVFHSHSFTIFFEYEEAITSNQIQTALTSPLIHITSNEEEPPSPAEAAGSSQIQLGNLKKDLLLPSGWWLWGVADNLRLTALQAIAALEEYCLS